MPSYAKRLKTYREAAGLTQEQLAAKAGTTSMTVSTHERGEVESPRSGIVQKLADALGVRAGDLLDPVAPAAMEPERPTSRAAREYLEQRPDLSPDEVAYIKGLFFGDGKPTDSTFTLALAAYRDAQRGVGPKARDTKLPANVKRRKPASQSR